MCTFLEMLHKSVTKINNGANNSSGKTPKLGRKARFKALLLDKSFEQENPKKFSLNLLVLLFLILINIPWPDPWDPTRYGSGSTLGLDHDREPDLTLARYFFILLIQLIQGSGFRRHNYKSTLSYGSGFTTQR